MKRVGDLCADERVYRRLGFSKEEAQMLAEYDEMVIDRMEELGWLLGEKM